MLALVKPIVAPGVPLARESLGPAPLPPPLLSGVAGAEAAVSDAAVAA